MSFAARSAEVPGKARAAAVATASPGAALALVGAFALLWQIRIGLWGDVSWLITANERWLEGARPYRDFIEMNPPASLWLYTPPVALAHALSLRPEIAVSAFGFLLTVASLALSFAIARGAGLLARVGALGWIAIPFAFLALPGDAFMERDVMAAVFGLPFVADAAARAGGRGVPFALALAAGVGVAMMIAIKPPFALIALLPALLAVRRSGFGLWLRQPEVYVAALLCGLYTAFVAAAYPDYARNVLPAALAVYLPIRESWVELLGSQGSLATLGFLLCGLYVGRARLAEPALAAVGLAAVGALLGYFTQGKGWLYQACPAIAFALMFAALALDDGRRSPRLWIAPGIVAVVAFWGDVLTDRWALGVVAGVALGLVAERAFRVDAAMRPLAAALLGATAALLCPGDIPDDAIARALARLGPHPTVMGVTESFGFAHPRARRLGAVWVQSAPTMLITAGARLLIDQHPGDAAVKNRVQPFVDAEKARLVDDILRQKPDALLVGPLETRFHAAIWNDPDVAAARRNYRLAAHNAPPDATGELWVREDLAARAGAAP